MDRPGGEPPQSRKSKALDLVLSALSGDEFGTPGESRLSEREFGRVRVKEWGRFARKHGLAYRDEPEPGEVAADARLVALFEELGAFGYPLHAVAGIMEGTWQGCPVVGFHTYDLKEDGRLSGYRFVCSPLPGPRPDLVHDRGLGGTSSSRAAWYPAFDTYEAVEVPTAPKQEKKRGLLARTPVGQAVAAVAGGLFGPYRPKLHTASPEYAAAFASRASQPYDERLFEHDWAVRGSWLVSHHHDGQSGLIGNGRRTAFLDAFALVRRAVE